MAEIPKSKKAFTLEFLRRTKRNLNNYDNDFDMTNLINCCLGLIVFPFEFGRNNSKPIILTKKAKDISKEIGFRFVKFRPIQDLRNGIPQLYPERNKTLELLLEKMRNGLAHQNIKPRNNNGFFDEIVVWNVFKRGRQPNVFSEIDVRIIFNQDQLRKFALMITDSYLPKNKK